MNVAYNMDCLDGMKRLDDCCIDLTVTSPPYDNIRDYNGYSFDWKATISELYRVTKQGGIVVWIVSDQTVDGSETGTSFRQALWAKECGFNLHDTMIWVKDGGGSIGSQLGYTQNFEYMFVFSKGKPKTTNIIKDKPNQSFGKIKRNSGRRRADGVRKDENPRYVNEFSRRNNWWYIPVGVNTTSHPAVFPSSIARDHIVSWSDEGDTVLDPFLGSGTTRIAAYDLNRQFIGFEISEEYFRLQEERFARHTAQMSLFEKEVSEDA